MSYIALYYIVFGIHFATMSVDAIDTRTFFPGVNGYASKVLFKHAVNTKALLDESLANDTVMMLEADIILGTIEPDSVPEPIMGHDDSSKSDISLINFLKQVDDFNAKPINKDARKGIKLDFKTIEAFENSVTFLASYKTKEYPIWLNADILKGPLNPQKAPVDANRFLSAATKFNLLLSIGWTTDGAISASYSEIDNIDQMIKVLEDKKVTQGLTFPVRALILGNSVGAMKKLKSKFSDSTLTIWSAVEDDVKDINFEGVNEIISAYGERNVYVDVPGDVFAKLKLSH